MSFDSAVKFLKQVEKDENLRELLQNAKTDQDELKIALDAGFEFNGEEYFAARGLNFDAVEFIEVTMDKKYYALSGW